jgi:hypothetical protein
MVTVKFVVEGDGWTPRVWFAATATQYDQRYDEWSCNSIASCHNKTVSVPYNYWLQITAATDLDQSYVNFGSTGSGGSSLTGTRVYPSLEERRCGPNYDNFSNDTCVFYLIKDYATLQSR